MSDDTEEEAIYRRLDDLTITGVAGVDFPAHLHDGWAVMKSVQGSQREGDEMSVLDPLAPGVAASLLEIRATKRARETNEPYYKAYAAVLTSEEGSALYSDYSAGMAAAQAEEMLALDAPPALEKAAYERVSGEDAVRLSKSAFPRLDGPAAMVAWLNTSEGADFYNRSFRS